MQVVLENELFQSSLLPLSEPSLALIYCFSVPSLEAAIYIAMQCSYGTPQFVELDLVIVLFPNKAQLIY